MLRKVFAPTIRPTVTRFVIAAHAASVSQPSKIGCSQAPWIASRWSHVQSPSQPATSAASAASRMFGQSEDWDQSWAPNFIRAALAGQLGQNVAAENLDPAVLIAPDVVEVALVEELLDLLAVSLRVGRDQHPSLEVLGSYELGHLREVVRRADVLLGELHAAVRPLHDRVLERLLVR